MSKFTKAVLAVQKQVLLLTLSLCLLLPGCSKVQPGPAYNPEQFTCTVTVDQQYTADCTGTPGSFVMTLTAPIRLSGLTLTFTDAGCTLSAGETVIPLSQGAAVSLENIASLMTAHPDTAADCIPTGNGTVYRFAAGQLILDANGLPAALETADGRTAVITNFVSIPTEKTA